MTPERWVRIDDLFNAALELSPSEREAWLDRACGDDDGLRSELVQLLDEDARAASDGFLELPELAGSRIDATGSWAPHIARCVEAAAPIERDMTISVEREPGFAPKAAILAGRRHIPRLTRDRSASRGCAD